MDQFENNWMTNKLSTIEIPKKYLLKAQLTLTWISKNVMIKYKHNASKESSNGLITNKK